ncbi:hypothetical protein [Chloroflexus aurantiacus]|uniref:hypothetical protein n=1 Tax=Chloroflexus aurantiacus TaxID=1108 RepID=UPI0015CFD438|nr:hypothetical protein [Chloroflexus aurantiacus]
MAAALQTLRHAHNERVRQPIQCVMTPTMVVNARLMLVRDALHLAGIGSNACGRQGQQRATRLARSTAVRQHGCRTPNAATRA